MAIPATFGKEKNAIDEFMLKEYESIASAHFDSQAGLRQQFRFYLLIAAVPITVLGLVLRDQPNQISSLSVFRLPYALGVVFFMVGFLGLLMLLSMIHTALDATLYARTVNGVRSYFVERGGIELDLGRYLKMPSQQNRPGYFHVRAFFWQVFLVGVVNSSYLAIGLQSTVHNTCVSIVASILAFLAQIFTYAAFCRQREKQEVPQST